MRRLPPEMAFPWFRGREAAWILHERLAGPTRIAALRNGPLAPLLRRVAVADVIARCGDGRLTPGRLLPAADPLAAFEPGTKIATDLAAEAAFESLCDADVRTFTVTFDRWGGRDEWNWRDEQTSRAGENLVVQVNFPEDYADGFHDVFGPEARGWLEYWSHPVRREGPLTMAWARLDLDRDTDEVLIEEIQTDWLREIRTNAELLIRDLPKSRRARAHAFVAETALKFGRDWAEATLFAAIALVRRKLGARHIWIHQPHTGRKLKNIRVGPEPPRSIYTDLPRRFCFRPTHRAPELVYRARSAAVRRLRRTRGEVFWHLDLDAPADGGAAQGR